MTESFLRFSTAEVAVGVTYVQTTKKVSVNPDLVRLLANETGEQWITTGRTSGRLYAIKREVLARHFTRRTPEELVRFDAYSSAVSKLFSVRSVLARARRRERGIPEPASTPADLPVNVEEEKNGQLAWLF